MVAYLEGAEMADDGGQRVVQAQADASCSAGSACNDGRDAVNHINELGYDTARAQGGSAWVSIQQTASASA